MHRATWLHGIRVRMQSADIELLTRALPAVC